MTAPMQGRRVTFKDEGEGMGQVYVIEPGAPETWPYGTTPKGIEDQGFMRRAEAQRLAVLLNARFEEI